MKISNTYPPNYEEILKIFDVADERVVMTYGDTIYNPHDLNINDNLYEHESIHAKQQKERGEEIWWDKYLADPQFRLEQELEAYGHQFDFVSKKEYNTKQKDGFLDELALALSSKIYGNIISFGEARCKIRKHGKR